ncbi:glycyl-radical enzyme activating protein [Erwinia mallotivora]|uniref:glycyl-radical enzyme activating protein n=1 Tax=Erwinia mallotivora TaxID=69222 RepID=UPI0021C1634A|nr:glycyl-radical enzyme activating protein [Erwinia mallotivora]
MKLSAAPSLSGSESITPTGTVFNLQRFSLHDGPGVRTVVFLKGCQMKCAWCANPESLASAPELFFDRARCAKASCWQACPGRGPADKAGHVGRVAWPAEDACPAAAIRHVGRQLSVDDVMRTVLADELYYRTSGGGMTLSGGEMALQPEFSRALLQRARHEGIHTAVETSGFASWPALWRACELSQLVLFDIKLADETRHQRYTGVSNHRILSNLKKLLSQDIPLHIRIPVIPEVNDSEEEAQKMMAMIAGIVQGHSSFRMIDLLPYHNFGNRKYELSGRECRYEQLHPDHGKPQVALMAAIARQHGLPTTTLSHCIG